MEPNYKRIAELALQQRDRFAAMAHSLEIDLILAHERITELEKKHGDDTSTSTDGQRGDLHLDADDGGREHDPAIDGSASNDGEDGPADPRLRPQSADDAG